MNSDSLAGRARAELRARLENLLAESEMGYTERFEHQADQFYRETGLMAPGKSLPLEMRQSYEDREQGWALFQERRRTQFQQDLRALLAGLGESQTALQHELNGWRELGEEMGRIVSFMTKEQYEDLCPDWFGPRLFDQQVKAKQTAAPVLPAQEPPQTEDQ